MSATETLPHFRRPPLTEFAVSIQFETLANFSYADIGPLREHFQSAFPGVEYHPPLPPIFETFGGLAPMVQFPFSFGAPLSIPRIWLIDEVHGGVLQFQPDRFVRNWRKTTENMDYPRYQSLRDEFVEHLASLEVFLRSRSIGNLAITQCELTYVNQMAAPQGVAEASSRAFSSWLDVRPSAVDPAEDVSISQRFVVRDEEHAPVGRIHFQAGPGIDAAGKMTLQFMVIGRGAPLIPSIEGAIQRLDMLHDRIVRTFVELITEDIQADWERAIL